MKQIAWLLKWALKTAIFFTLFAFALNNQQDVTVHFFFGRMWQAPMVLVVLAAFAGGVMVGVLGMVPRWWGQRQTARRLKQSRQTDKAMPTASPELTPEVSPTPATASATPPDVPATTSPATRHGA